VTIAVALVLPWLFGGISLNPKPGDAALAAGFALGPWALLVVAPPAILLGALASRAVTRSAGVGAMTLVGGWICVVVAGLPRSPVRWLAPPLIDITKAARGSLRLNTVAGLTAWALIWALAIGAGYVALRRQRA
jgi:hypothetical protein